MQVSKEMEKYYQTDFMNSCSIPLILGGNKMKCVHKGKCHRENKIHAMILRLNVLADNFTYFDLHFDTYHSCYTAQATCIKIILHDIRESTHEEQGTQLRERGQKNGSSARLRLSWECDRKLTTAGFLSNNFVYIMNFQSGSQKMFPELLWIYGLRYPI